MKQAAIFIGAALATSLILACKPERPNADQDPGGGTPPTSNPAPAPVETNPSVPHAKEEVSELTLKRLLCAAAAIDREDWKEIAVKGNIDPEALIADGETLTEFVIFSTSRPPEEGDKRFLRIPGTTDPAVLAEALDPGPRSLGLVSVLQMSYFTSLDYEIHGNMLTGNARFEAKNGAYEGAFGFQAIRDDSEAPGWVITAFLLAEDGLRLERESKDDSWKRVEKPPVTSLDARLKGAKKPSIEDVLKLFAEAEFKTQDDVRAAIRAAAGSPTSVSYLHLAWSAQSEFHKRDFAKFVLSKKRKGMTTPVTVHFIDCTPITEDYGALYDLPGWDRKRDAPAGWGEVLWMKNGRVVHFERIDRFATTDELLAKTEKLFAPADQALIADPIVEARFRMAINKPKGALDETDLEKDVWRLDFRFTDITDDGLKDVAKLTGIRELLFSLHAKITDAGLKEVAKLTTLEGLSLWQTSITDAGIKELAKLTNLTSLNLQQTSVSTAGVAELQKALPKCRILHPTNDSAK